MRRCLYLLTCVLALATGLVLLAAGAAIRQPAVPQLSATHETRMGLVRAFYDAVNLTLATGDPELFGTIVAPDLVEYPARLGEEHGLAGLIAALHSRRTLFPNLRLVVDELVVTGADRVTARIHTEGGIAGSYLGLSVPVAFAEWGPLDLFRIADGRIVERWGGTPDRLVVQPLGQAVLTTDPPSQAGTLVLSRTQLAPGTAVEIGEIIATDFLFVAAGRPTVSVDGEPTHPLATGEFLEVPASSVATLGNAGDMPALVFTFTLWPIAVSPSSVGGQADKKSRDTGSWPDEQAEPDVETQVLSAIADMPTVDVVVGRLTLAAGTSVPFAAGDRHHVVAVEEGLLETATPQVSVVAHAAYVPGEAIAIGASTDSTWRAGNSGPMTALLIEIAAPDRSA